MEISRRKQLLAEYANRKPEMGIISLACEATGDVFLGTSNDTKASLNGLRFKLETGSHPNRSLRELWQQYGEAGFTLSVVEVLDYEDAKADYTQELEEMLEQHLEENKEARRIWK
ncbi:hypothetical protein M2150_001071 [Lachnospiraceae bacterium PM6-15]|uniref:GIY-YIG nuclease family protein n=1 Tax=Ohessyouella blattaphilus TaxID=2949333 RepID=A0ABT1EKF5_9FIRM|nr:GIY-YIG nuclease family protein [Ohessyouella blattaphilus]MCP1111174.1 GIY-YIG nuclease family protein [Ohessyouella blattaphilus]MCR8564568.1 GIY-YIG nuclease family protein [Ohessyouella blattaphilus]MDL2251068.1 GIY-YIG nuclease family protein [Lachnospiraceae bacterium OttesenSCG-928-J05]